MDMLINAANAANVQKGVGSSIELLPHNQMLYNKIVAEIEKGERNIFYSEATGLGKSFIFMRLVQDYFRGKKILYVVPKVAIWKNLIRYKEFGNLDSNIIMTTFAAFNRYDSSMCDEYDAVFVDECHHMLSDIQGSNLQEFCKDMSALNKYSFGFTATPYYKGVYVDEACFDVSCYGYDICEAIDLGILPKIHFSVANIDIENIPMDMRARYSITGTKTLLEQLLERNMGKSKWIAYFLNKKELEQNVHELKTLFPNYTILKVYEGIENEDAIYDEFNSSTGRIILLSVNKLLEGVHLKGVQGVLLYRNVTEFSTYMQMYGRLCDISAKESPIFLDVANAIFSINKISDINIFKSSRCPNKPKRKLKDFFDVHADDYWTVDLSIIINMYKTTWTLEDDELLKNNSELSVRELLKLFPGRTEASIRMRKTKLGLSKPYSEYTKEQEKFLAENYLSTPISQLSTLLGHSPSSIKTKARSMGLYQKKQSDEWSKDEDDILKNNPDLSATELASMLPGRTIKTIYSRRSKIGLSRISLEWEEWEDNIVKEYWNVDKEIVYEKLPNRTRHAIDGRASTLGLCLRRQPISDSTKSYILSNCNCLTMQELSEHTGLSKTRIRTLLRTVGIDKPRVRKEL